VTVFDSLRKTKSDNLFQLPILVLLFSSFLFFRYDNGHENFFLRATSG